MIKFENETFRSLVLRLVESEGQISIGTYGVNNRDLTQEEKHDFLVKGFDMLTAAVMDLVQNGEII